jgi:hypothetical protein
MAPFL